MDSQETERLIAENEALRRRIDALEAEKASEHSRREYVVNLERVLRELPLPNGRPLFKTHCLRRFHERAYVMPFWI